MTSEPSKAYLYLSLDPDAFMEGHKGDKDFWPPVSDPKTGTIYPRVRHAYLFSDDTRAQSPEYLKGNHEEISRLLKSTEPQLKKLVLALLPTDKDENYQSNGEFGGWTEDEAEDKCSEMQQLLGEQFKPFISTLGLNHTRLLSAWVSKQVVCDAALINKSAQKKPFGAMIFSRWDTDTVLAHYPWGPGISLSIASQYTFQQQREKCMEKAPDIAGRLHGGGLSDRVPTSVRRNGFGFAEISNESMDEFSWLTRHTGTTDDPI